MPVRSTTRKKPSKARKPQMKSTSTRRTRAKKATVRKVTRKTMAKKAAVRKVTRKTMAKKPAAKKARAKKATVKRNAVHKQLEMLRKKLAKEQAFRKSLKRDFASLNRKIARAA